MAYLYLYSFAQNFAIFRDAISHSSSLQKIALSVKQKFLMRTKGCLRIGYAKDYNKIKKPQKGIMV